MVGDQARAGSCRPIRKRMRVKRFLVILNCSAPQLRDVSPAQHLAENLDAARAGAHAE